MSRGRKALCLLLSFVFLFQLLPVMALAADEDASRTNEGSQPAELSDAVAADEIAVLGEDTSMTPPLADSLTRTIMHLQGREFVVAICLHIVKTALLRESISAGTSGKRRLMLFHLARV